MQFDTTKNGASNERMRIDSSGRLLVGTTSDFGSGSAGDVFQIATPAGGHVLLGRNDSSVSVDESMGLIRGYSYGGSVWEEAGRIAIQADAAHGSGNKPGRIVFSTTPNGSALPTERMRITSGGGVLLGMTDYLGVGTLQVKEALAVCRTTNAGNSGQNIGTINFSDTRTGTYGMIKCVTDAVPGTNDFPGRLQFHTTADGASSPTERMRIGYTGNVLFYNATNYVAPFTDNAVTSGASGRRWSQVWAANGTIQTSDERLKTEIAASSLATDFVKSLRPVSYKWIEGGKRHTGEYDEDNNFVYETVAGSRTHWGFIAQEVKQSADDAGVDFGGWVLEDKDDADSTQSLRYDQFVAPLTAALQEAIAKIETLEAKVAALEAG